jgi:hypothetical protein
VSRRTSHGCQASRVVVDAYPRFQCFNSRLAYLRAGLGSGSHKVLDNASCNNKQTDKKIVSVYAAKESHRGGKKRFSQNKGSNRYCSHTVGVEEVITGHAGLAGNASRDDDNLCKENMVSETFPRLSFRAEETVSQNFAMN